MTESYAKKYRCLNDCREEGCPGHRLVLNFHNTSDTTSIQIDGEHQATFDDNAFVALLNLSMRAGYSMGKSPERIKDHPDFETNSGRQIPDGDPQHADSK